MIKYLNFETLHHCFEHVFNEIMHYVLNNIEDVKKIYFPTQKHICHCYTLGKMYQHSFSENSICFSEPLRLIHLDLLKLSILSYSKYKQVITFLDNHSSYCNIAFLCKKSKAVEAVKSIFWMWSNTTIYFVKRLYTDNRGEYIMLELQFFLREQEIIHETSTLHVY